MSKSSEPTPLFSLVIPCYNESKSLPELIARAALTAELGGGEVILVNNGSTDNTARIMSSARPIDGVRFVTVDVNQGYGFGILAGLRVARGNYVGWSHADLQTDPADVLRVIEVMEDSNQPAFIKGKRYGRPLSDVVFTYGMSVFESALLGTRLSDINAQPTLFDRSLLASWGEPPHDFSLDLFAYYQARKQKFKVIRFPVLFAPRRHGTSSWNIDFAAKRKFIKRTIDYSFKMKRGL